ncbi:GIY-YIG catalytic domain-containing endonuclease [Acanthocystis turfacea Chlorella virus Br0604L]|nr:GIY-YIG catalytic domain-containing endonuclease [Acanthocystis turfacea Chlorella virus Br0604L]
MNSQLLTEMLIAEEYFVLDNVMYWEAFRWERLDTGHIYIQKFQTGKMYAGQTINLPSRFNEYRNLKGNNPHHAHALKKYGWDNTEVATTRCPKYLLDDVEIFVIAFFNLTNPTKGYNKMTGGRKGSRCSKETRLKMSISHLGKTQSKETRMKISISQIGEKHHMFDKRHTEESRAKMSEKLSGRTLSEQTRTRMSIAQFGEKNHMFGKTLSEETRKKMSTSKKGRNNQNAKPLCAFGKLYDSASTASDMLRDVCNTTARDAKFMTGWVKSKKHQHNVFYVSKEFYEAMNGFTECITRDMYDQWNTL